jgi:hypothetical protein
VHRRFVTRFRKLRISRGSVMAGRGGLRIEMVGIMSCVGAANVACRSNLSCRSLRSRAEMADCPGCHARGRWRAGDVGRTVRNCGLLSDAP